MTLKVIDLIDYELPYQKLETIKGNSKGDVDWYNIRTAKIMSRDSFIDKYRDCYIYSMKVYHDTKTVSVIFGTMEGEFQGIQK